MGDKKFSEKELEQVVGGQAVLPLKGAERPSADQAAPVGAGKIKICENCGEIVICTSQHSGTVVRCSCGAEIRF